MSRVISFRDLQLCPGLQYFNEIELLHPSKDALVNWHLEKLGFNINAPIEYIPNNHRDMQGNVGIGFRAVGTVNTDSPYMKSRLATMEDRIMAAYFKDPSLAREMASMLGAGIRFTDVPDNYEPDEDDFPEDFIEPDYEDVCKELKQLEEIRDQIRGVV